MQSENDELLTTEQAAALAGVSQRTLARWRKLGKIEPQRGRIRVVESRPGLGWKREDVLRVAGLSSDEVPSQPAALN